jgi:hypothetical protein
VRYFNICRSVINRRQTKRVKKEFEIIGDTGKELTKDLHEESNIFAGKSFCASIAFFQHLMMTDIMTGADPPISLSKVDLEKLVKENGGSVFQSEKAAKPMIVIAEKSTTAA